MLRHASSKPPKPSVVVFVGIPGKFCVPRRRCCRLWLPLFFLLFGGVCCVVCRCFRLVGCRVVPSLVVLLFVAVGGCRVVVAFAGCSSVLASRSCLWVACLGSWRVCVASRRVLALVRSLLAGLVCSWPGRWWSSSVCLGLSCSAWSVGSRLRLLASCLFGGGLFFYAA